MASSHCFIKPSLKQQLVGEKDSTLTLPLLHFDITWLYFHPVQRLLFFNFPCSTQHFQEAIVPKLKNSLSRALKHFPPLSGNIIHPIINSDDDHLQTQRPPFTRFVPDEDSVSLKIAQSDKDFELLTGNGPRVTDDFYDCVPHLPPVKHTADETVIPVIGLQITHFPDRGFCLGFTNHHAIGDASSVVRFIKAWARISNLLQDADVDDDIDEKLSIEKLLPVFDRSSVADPDGLDSLYWNLIRKDRVVESPPITFPINKLRTTFILTPELVQKLKSLFVERRPGKKHVTSFTVACALVWSCLVKAEVSLGSVLVSDDEPEYFGFAADCRSRLNPPLPASYFGNCLAFVKAETTHGLLKGDEGFLYAADCIGEAIQKTVYNEKGILDGAENWASEFGKLIGKRLFGVAGSPRFDLYDVDYGYGKPKKFESASIDSDTSMSLCKSRDFEGGLEIGLSRDKKLLDAFTAIFDEATGRL